MKRDKVIKYLDDYQKLLRPEDDQSAFLLGICQMQLGDYEEAHRLFQKSCVAMFVPPMFWKRSNQPHRLVDVCVLSGREYLYEDVKKELNLFGAGDKKEGLYLIYSFGLMELLSPSNNDIMNKWIERWINKPKIKDMHAIGLIFHAIVDGNQADLNNSLEKLLRAHEGQVKHGDLKWTPEGLVCMPAMSLTYAALIHGLNVKVEDDYLPIEYLRFLINKRK